MSIASERSFWRGPWPWVAAAGLLVVGYAAWVFLSFALSDESIAVDDRPPGGPVDIVALAERDDTNILFVVIDTLRAERLRTYGYGRATSPFLDVFASQGVRFDRHLAQSSWTKSSMASLWSGLYPQRAGVTRFDDVVPDGARLPAEILSDAGFRTAGIWRNGWVEGYFGFAQGFDTYGRPGIKPTPPEIRRENPTAEDRGTDEDVVRAAEEFLRIHGRHRWFLYLHLMDVHEYTYDASTAKFGTAMGDIYDNAVLRTNYVLDLLFEKLAERGMLDETIFVVSSDHGEAFGERGLEGHARAVYRETTEVPWIIGFPFRLERPAVVETRTANVDIWPTLLDLVGIEGMEDVDGRSRVPEILAAARGESPPERSEPPKIAHLDQTWGQRVETTSPMVTVSEGTVRYVQTRSAKGEVREQLFDAARDTGELTDRLADQPEVAARLRGVADAYLASEPAFGDTEDLEIDEIQLNQLRALGYALP